MNIYSPHKEEETVMDINLESRLVVINDENTFENVILSLMEVLKHSSEQAEQLSLIIHHKGRATVKTGSFDELHPFKDALCERGLSAIIEI